MPYIDSSPITTGSEYGGVILRLNYDSVVETDTTYSLRVTTLQLIATKTNPPSGYSSGEAWYGFAWDFYAYGSTQMRLTGATTQTSKPKSTAATRVSGKKTTYTWTFNKTYTWSKGHSAQSQPIVGQFVMVTYSQDWGAVDTSGGITMTFGDLSVAATLNVTVPALESHTVDLAYNDGTGRTETLTKWFGESLPLPQLSRTGYRFDGWRDTETSAVYTQSYAVEEDTSLAAVLTPVITAVYIDSLSVERADGAGQLDDEGTRALVSVGWRVEGAATGQVSITAEMSTAPATTVSDSVSKQSTDDLSGQSSWLIPGAALTSRYMVEVEVSIPEESGSQTAVSASRTAILPFAFFTMDVKAGGHGVAFGKPATQDIFDVGMETNFDHDVKVLGTPLVPVGTILDFAAATAPSGYLVCDGSAVSRTTYSALFAVIGTTWGAGDGSTTFNVPDLRGRAAIGSGTGTASDATAHALGSSGGTETHKLSGDQSGNPELTHSVTQPTFRLPAHNHEMPNSFVVYRGSGLGSGLGSGTGAYGTNNGSGFTKLTSGAVNASTRPMCDAVQSAAVTKHSKAEAAQAHPNMQPFATVTKIIRAI